jgi:hypothetical protein
MKVSPGANVAVTLLYEDMERGIGGRDITLTKNLQN